MTTRLLVSLAHPDDEILGPGGTLAHYANCGAYVELICATRGEAGEIADPALATPETLGQVREAELRCSASRLGIRDVTFLGFRDSGMAGSADNGRSDAFMNIPPAAVVPRLVAAIRRVRPQVIITFEPHGGYGHPDHIAIHRHTHAAFTAAADPAYRPDLGAAWRTDRLFYPLVRTQFFQELKAGMERRGLETDIFDDILQRRDQAWPDDRYHVVMDVRRTVTQKMAAFACHRTQFGPDSLFRRLPPEEMRPLLSQEYFALALPEPQNGLALPDLFAGLTV